MRYQHVNSEVEYWAHNPGVPGSKPGHANDPFLTLFFLTLSFQLIVVECLFCRVIAYPCRNFILAPITN
jgi:hypothetical protein